jgi:hypothetical protein
MTSVVKHRSRTGLATGAHDKFESGDAARLPPDRAFPQTNRQRRIQVTNNKTPATNSVPIAMR